jgi:hypothetical protein
VKGFLDSHPLSALVGFSVSAASIVAGVMLYYTSQRLAAEETRHKAEMHELATNDKAALLDATNPLKQTIADLTFRLSSIERRITGTGPTYFDVSSVSVGPETIKALGPKYKAFAGGDFYVASPEMGSWSYYETNEWDFLSSMYDFLKLNGTRFRPILSDSKLHVWRGKSQIRFQGESSTAIEHPTFTFYPAVSVQKLTAEMIKSRLSKVMEESSDEKTDLKVLAGAIDQLNKRVRTDGDASNNDVSNDNDNVVYGPRITEAESGKDVLQTVKRKTEVLDNLSSAYSADDASYVLTDYLEGAMNQTMVLGAHHRVYSTQKKGNVLYLQDQITFQNVQVYDGEKLGEAKQNVVVDEEVFYFGNGAEGFLVKIILPPVPDRADAFLWTKSWLTGLQIPLG